MNNSVFTPLTTHLLHSEGWGGLALHLVVKHRFPLLFIPWACLNLKSPYISLQLPESTSLPPRPLIPKTHCKSEFTGGPATSRNLGEMCKALYSQFFMETVCCDLGDQLWPDLIKFLFLFFVLFFLVSCLCSANSLVLL